MNKSILLVPLTPTPQQAQSLLALQQAFAEVCNALAPTVRETRCWNRVTLHHLTYRSLRERFPKVGSQMVCNAIYSVSRTCRVIFQTQGSPLNIQRLVGKPLPLMHFLPTAPVFFDRHTLSVRHGVLSMYTLDGRMRFQINLSQQDEERFARARLQEIVLKGTGQQFSLSFSFVDKQSQAPMQVADTDWPHYVLLTNECEALDGSPHSNIFLPQGALDRAPHQAGVPL